MGCNAPRVAWKAGDRWVRNVTSRRKYLEPGRGVVWTPRLGDGRAASVPCGQCLGCRLDWAADWSVRCEKEAKLWPHNSFVTLTYSDAELPMGSSTRSSVSKREVQLFLKRLRKARSEPVRFFASGEYGEQNERAHYHLLLFNCAFPDKLRWRVHRGNTLYRSPELEQLWPFGFSTIGEVNSTTANYVARYVVKKLRGSMAAAAYADREPPFVLMSNRPGIGAGWLDRFKSDVFPSGRIVYGEGRERPAPRYFVKRLSPEERIGYTEARVKLRLAQPLTHTKREVNLSQVREARETNLAARLNLSGRNL